MIVRFNLLPYRLIEKQQQRRRFYYQVLLTIASALLCLFLYHAYRELELDKQRRLNQQLETISQSLAPQLRQINTLNSNIAEMQKQLDLLQELRRQQHWYALLLVDLARQTPKEVTLNTLELEVKNITLHGHAESPQALTALWQNLQREAISMELVELNEMRNVPQASLPEYSQDASAQDFVMVAKLRPPPLIQGITP